MNMTEVEKTHAAGVCVDVNAEQGEEVNSGGGSGLQKHIINSNNTNLIL